LVYLQSILDQRSAALHHSVGFSPAHPPNLLTLARALVGVNAITYWGTPSRRGAALTDLKGQRCRICLDLGLTSQEMLFAIARGLAHWDVARGGCRIEACHVEQFARTIALTREIMDRYHDEWKADASRIAREMHLPLEVVEARERSFVELTSVPEIKTASVVSSRPRAAQLLVAAVASPASAVAEDTPDILVDAG